MDQLPRDIIDLLYHATFSAATMKTILRFLSLVVAGITLSLLLTWLYANYTSKLYRRRLANQIKCQYSTSAPIYSSIKADPANLQENHSIISHRPIS